MNQEYEIPEGLKEAADRLPVETVGDAGRLKEEMFRAFRDRTAAPPDVVATAARLEYHCVLATGGTFIEEWGIDCVRCAWYVIDGSTSERVSDFSYSCIVVPDRVARQ